MSNKILASNRKVFHDYHVLDTWESGIVLKGTEIKALRTGQASISEAWIKLKDGEAWLIGCHIPPYEPAHSEWATHEPTRDRKLLLHKSELLKIDRELPGATLVAIDIHLNDHNFAKVTVALVKGKKNYDKREAIKERDQKRDEARGI